MVDWRPLSDSGSSGPFRNGAPESPARDDPDILAFDPRARTEIYHRHLPHWRQDGVVYFVTFRLADSIPLPVLRAWAVDRRTWLAAHGISDRTTEEEFHELYEAIPSEVRLAFERECARRYLVQLDRCHGECHLRRSDVSALVADALRFHHDQRLRCGDFVIMPNHVHWLVIPLPDHSLESLLQSIKRWCSTRINRLIGRSGTLWQGESFDHIVRSSESLERIRDYIRDNPVRAHLGPDETLYYKAEWLK